MSTYTSDIQAFAEASQRCPYISKAPRQYVVCLPARMHLGRYMNGVLLPSVILPASSPATEKLKQLSRWAPSPPFQPFASVGNYRPNKQTARGCPNEPPSAGHGGRENLLSLEYNLHTQHGQGGEVRGHGWEEKRRRRSCGWPSSAARGGQVAGDGRLV